MATIRTTCPSDGEVDLDARDVVIDVDAGVYRFSCIGPCRQTIAKKFDRRIWKLLRQGGVRTIDEIVAEEIGSLDKL